jgi:hypothetical protein
VVLMDDPGCGSASVLIAVTLYNKVKRPPATRMSHATTRPQVLASDNPAASPRAIPIWAPIANIVTSAARMTMPIVPASELEPCVAQALDVAAAVRHVRFELARRRRLAQSSLPMALLPPVRILIAVVVHSKRCTYLSRLREVCVPYGDRAGPGWIHFLDHFLLTRQRPTCQGVACALS